MLTRLQLILQDAAKDSFTPDQASFERWALLALDAVDQSRRCVTLRLVDEAEMRSLNRTYRDRDYPTNVLSFEFDGPRDIEPDLLGDIVICSSVIRKEAGEQIKPVVAHWAHMVVHGILHLCGYDHADNKAAEQMEALEVNILGELGFPDPYRMSDQPFQAET